MSKIIKVSDLNETKFYQLPKALFHNPKYSQMKNESKIAYSILRDLLDLSIKHNWINENNEVYVKLSRKKLMNYLNIKGKQKIAAIMKELIKNELIVEKQVGLKKCNEIYICIPEELNKIYNDEELLEINEKKEPQTVENTLTFENQTSRSLKIKPQEVRKSNLKKFENQTHTNTNIINTNIINSSSNSGNIQNMVKEFKECLSPLGKTTLPKFIKYLNTYDHDFVKEIIHYCDEKSNKKSFSYFKKVIDSYIEQGVITKESFLQSVQAYNTNKTNKKSKNSYKSFIKEKVDHFNNFDQRDYDFEKLENKLLAHQYK